MATVASRFLAIGSAEPNISSGWTIRVLDYKDLKSPVAIVHEFSQFSFTQELNGTGQGSITMDEDSPFWTAILNNGNSNRALLNNEYVFEAWDGGTPRFAWLAQTVTNTIVGEDETRAITISGPGIAGVLNWAVVNRPGWPTKVPITGYKDVALGDPPVTKKIAIYRDVSASDKVPAYNWQFPYTWPTMRMWCTVFTAAQRRGLLKWVTPMFTPLKDSAKQDWIWIKTIDAVVTKLGYQPEERNQTLLEFLADCTGQDYSKWFGQRLEWIMYPGFKLDVRRHIGTDRSSTVRFFQGNIISDERTRDRENIRNRIIAQDVIGNETNRSDTKSVASWNLREQFNTTNKNVTLDSMRAQLADRYIQQFKDEKDEWSIKIPYDDPGRVPYRNFFVGDYIGLNVEYFGSTPTAAAGPTKYRVMAITVSLSAEQTVPDCELTLNTLIDSKLSELEKQITQMLNNPTAEALKGLKDVSIGTTPEVQSTLVYNPETKQWEPQAYPSTSSGSNATYDIYVQKNDPAATSGNTVSTGDFWLETYD